MCNKPGCEKSIRAAGLCSAHYSAARVLKQKQEGYLPPDRRKTYTGDELENYWLWIKKELKLV